MLERDSEKYKTPVAVYVIFETQENKSRCLKLYESIQNSLTGNYRYPKETLKVLSHPIPVENTSEPSNIIWEN